MLVLIRGTQIFQKSRIYLKILRTRRSILRTSKYLLPWYLLIYKYRYALHKVSVHNGPHIQQWSHKIITLQYNIIILAIVLQLPTVFSTVTCCTGLQARSNKLYHIVQVCSRLCCTIQVCVSTLYDVRKTTKSPNDAFLRMYLHR